MQQQDGNALVQVLLLTTVLYGLVTFGSRTARTEVQIATNQLLSKQALDIAEAGLNHAFDVIRTGGPVYDDELGNGGAGGSLANLGSLVALDGNNYRFRAFGGGANDGYYVRVVDNYDEQTGANDPTIDKDGAITVISRGRIGGAERVINATLANDPLLKHTLFGKDGVTFTGDSYIDSFDSRVGPYGSVTPNANGHVRSNGAISLSGTGTSIRGDATAGTTVSEGTGTITGAVTENAPPLSFPPVSHCSPPSSGAGISGTGNWSYDIYGGSLQVSGGDITLAEGTYCFSSVSFLAQSSLTVSGPVKIYLNGSWDTSAGSIVNTTTLPANLQIFAHTHDSHGNIKFAGGAQAFMSIYAPNATITLTGGTNYYGAIVGGRITVNGGTHIHYDESLGTIPSGNVLMSNWHEVRTG